MPRCSPSGIGVSKLVVKLFAEFVVNESSPHAISIPPFFPASHLFLLYSLLPGTSMRFTPYGCYKHRLESPNVEDFAVQHTTPLDLLLPLSSCLPLTEVATEPTCVARVSDEPPTQAWGSPQSVWFLWQQPNTPELCIPSGLWCNSQLCARWHCLELVDLTSLSPPSV